MFHIEEIPQITALLKCKDRPRWLLPKDLAVLIALFAYLNNRSGKVMVQQEQLAEDLGYTQPLISTSLKRLRQANLLVHNYDRRTGEKYYLLNPSIFSVGSHKKRQQLFKDYKALCAE